VNRRGELEGEIFLPANQTILAFVELLCMSLNGMMTMFNACAATRGHSAACSDL
jgi:hypothetical protein